MNQLQHLGRTIIDQISGLGRALLMLASALLHVVSYHFSLWFVHRHGISFAGLYYFSGLWR